MLITTLTLLACKEKAAEKVHVRSVRIIKTTLASTQENSTIVPASINEKRETKLAFRVRGPLVRLNDTIGNFVKKGQVIAKVDARDYAIAVESTQAAYKLANAEYKRYKTLLEKESVATSVYDQIESNYTRAKTAYQSAQNALYDTDLRAPFSGYISKVLVNNFEEVNPGQPIISLIDLSEFEVKAWISLKDLTKMNENTQYACLINVGNKKIRIPGKLKEIGHKSSNSKQSYPISILIDAPKDNKLRAGMTTHLEIINTTPNPNPKIDIPVSCVFSSKNKSYVWLYDEHTQKVSAKEVVSGDITADDFIQIHKGLSAGVNIVSTGVHYLTEGQKVKVLKAFTKSNVGNKL
ncbi:putative efflux pump periplasmic linker TtgA precursor [Saccharicrinis fermentans DSM 9555 = JCM 21142]|uniref:Putative efflux pump periplasmic linker TtgA n=2 Tax=Saccharicrinis fermentans TaxID=982 RepID=W7YSU2_9BACT|nr:putative efflux pump periplasmic linker TtgA precursor [Saccharicrinis fermentans DSM 9555 = JCM 21142]